jgi:hypothetical protein
MRLEKPTAGAVDFIVRNAHDLEEAYTLHGHRQPEVFTYAIMAQPLCFVAWADKPVAAFGGSEIHKGVWQMFLTATKDFPQVALGLTRFAKRQLVPNLGTSAHRLQCDLHEKHAFVHRWVETFGATRESVKKHYASDGSNYFHYVLKLDKSDKSC